MASTRIYRTILLAAIGLVALAGALLIYYTTVWGPWAFSDSASYLSTARNLIAGHGFGIYNPDGSFVPFTYYPPLYPLLLAIPGLLGVNMVTGARVLNILLFGLLTLILCWGAYQFIPQFWPALGLGALILTSSVLLDDYSSMMSEPIFIFTGFSGLVALLYYLWRHQRAALILAGLATALAMLSRYIGFTFVITGVLGILLLDDQCLKHRVRDVAIYGGISVVPIIASQLWVYSQIGQIGGRNFGLNASTLTRLKDYLSQTASYLNSWVPYVGKVNKVFSPPFSLVFLAILGIALFTFIWIRLYKKVQFKKLLQYNSLMLIFCVVYLVCLGLSYTISYPNVAIENRMLSPLLPAIFSLAVGLLAGLAESLPGRRWSPLVCILIILVILRFYQTQASELVNQYHGFGYGYTAKTWDDPTEFKPLQQIPAGVKVISNDPALVLFYLNWFPYDLSVDRNSFNTVYPSTFGSGDDALEVLFRKGAALVLFIPTWKQTFGDNATIALAKFTQGLVEAYAGANYRIYYYP